MLSMLATAVILLGIAEKATATSMAWSDLPWSDLEKLISPTAELLQTSPLEFAEQCSSEYLKQRFPLDPTKPVRSQYNLVDQPSGLCMNQMFCAYERCNPLPLTPDEAAELPVNERWNQISFYNNPDAVELAHSDWLDASNPAWNLPSTVLFPVIPGDVTAAVAFARDNGIGISIKNSGHSYTGASTKKDTLLLNMNHYTEYSPTGVIECGNVDEAADPYLEDQPCRLAKAKGKPGVLRVGGGENFGEAYTSVKVFNEAQAGGYLYHLVGGAAGTVSPMGWTWQGGLAGTTAGRMHGFGVDQVLQIEMVLPNGYHVRFGPTDWDDVDAEEDEYTMPRTTAVSGVCQKNPEEPDESKWIWEDCAEDIDFDDLWFAVNGGSGGTWGVVTSVYLVLHEYEPLETITNGVTKYPDGIVTVNGCAIPSEYAEIVEVEWWNFYISFLFDPSSIGVTEEASYRCASPTYNWLYCYGKDSSKAYTGAWTRYISSRRQALTDEGVPTSTIDLVSGCTGKVDLYKDYSEVIVIKEGPNKGKADDRPSPSYMSGAESDVNIIVPAKYIVENRDTARKLILDSQVTAYCAFGGKAGFAQDRANCLSEAHRLGGWMLQIPFEFLDESFFTEEFPKMFDTSDDNNFPSFIGGNHVGPNMRGPLKNDWTKPCPLDWTQQERDDGCISLQESLWGTKTLNRLESIKESIDPDFIFDCYGCVLNDRDTSSKKGKKEKEGKKSKKKKNSKKGKKGKKV